LEVALQAHQAGRFAPAEQIYRAVLATDPANADALHLLGVLLLQTGKTAEGKICLEKAIQRDPSQPDYHHSLGQALQREGNLVAAVNAYRAALTHNPALAPAHNNLGNTLRAAGDWAGAITAFECAHRLKPDDPQFAYNLGTTLHHTGNSAAAIPLLELACRLCPESVDAAVNLGNALLTVGQTEPAIARYQAATALAPKDADIWSNLGNAAKLAGDRNAALDYYRTAVGLNSSLGAAQANLASELADQCEVEAAVEHYRAAARTGDISLTGHSNLLLLLHYVAGISAAEIAAEHRRWAEQHAAPLAREILPHRNTRDPERKLRVGFVSPDFREHPVARFILPIWAQHDRQQFQFFAYSDARKQDSTTAQLREQPVEWRDTASFTDPQLAQIIRRDEIDLLVDLAGHTAQSRLLLFARKPAPVQLTYLGYPNSTGLPAIDYRIVDGYSDPPGLTDVFCSEKLCRMRQTAWCYRPPAEVPAPDDPKDSPREQFWFGSLNNLSKISSFTVTLWAEVLAAVPQAGLLLKAGQLTPPPLHEAVRARFAAAGVAPDRIRFCPRTPTQAEHFSQYRRVDVALDTFPYHGTTTTCDALWMGVPVVSLAGQTHHSRVGVSLLTNLGHPEWVAASPTEFVQIAASLASSPARLAELRTGLRSEMAASPLCTEPGVARDMESIFRQVWEQWCRAKS
jgi:predicted O-linked N-acetylglucosamine transferase (SPINDLY family)